MGELALRYEACVHTRLRGASCRACVEACPERAVSLVDGSIRVALADCTGCGVCQGACPTGALGGVFDAGQAVAAFATAEVVRCGEHGVPCVSGLAVEDWIALAAGRESVRVEGCALCEGGPAYDQLADHLAQASAALGVPFTVIPREPEPAGRALLRRLWAGRGEGELALDLRALDPAAMRARSIPERRTRTLAALPSASPEVALPAEAARWTSAKRLDVDTCTGCQLCVNTCPTGALSTTRRRDELRFDAAACVRCGLCHDACAPGSLTLGDTVSLAALRAGPVSLGRLATRRCAECGELYVVRDGAELCPRCADLDAEARELLGLERR